MEWLAAYQEFLAPALLLSVLILFLSIGYSISARKTLKKTRSTCRDLKEEAQALRALLERDRRSAEETEREVERLRAEAAGERRIAEDALAEMAQYADRLKKLNQAKSRFMSGVSWRLRTPLTLTMTPLEEITRRFGRQLDPDVRSNLELARRNAQRILLFVQQILDMSLLDGGRIHVRPTRMDLREVLRDLSVSFAPWAERKKIELQLDLPPEDIVVHADHELTLKALVNVTKASFKSTPAGGTIRITLNQPRWFPLDAGEGAYVTVQVRDSGPGIPPEELPLLFERFYEIETDQQTELSVALELPLAKELIEIQKGFVDVKSEIGFGTEITLYLKAGDTIDTGFFSTGDGDREDTATLVGLDCRDPEDSAHLPESETQESDRTTVLVVEDNEDVQTLLRRILEPGLRVVVARDGNEALRLVRDVTPDLVLSDIMMPGMDGIELCQRLKRDPELGFIPVILLTAKADVQDRIEGLQEGADDYIVKPFDPSELKARVRNLIAQRKRIRNRFSKEFELHASDIEVISSDDIFVRSVKDVIEAHIDDEDFSVEDLARTLGISRGHLHRRLKTLLKMSPSEALRKIRLERAKMLLDGRAGTVSEIAYRVGFRSVSHFCRCFKAAYGRTPAEIIAESEGGPES